MGRPQPWCQKYPNGRGCRNCRSRLPGADASAATRSLFPDLCRIRGAEPSPEARNTNRRRSPDLSSPSSAPARNPRPRKASALRIRIEADGSRLQSPGAAATKTICALLPVSRARSVVGSLARPITSGSRSRARLAVGCRMSSQYRCAAFTIASSTVLATSALGGTNSISIRFRLRSGFGNRRRACLRGQMANPKLTRRLRTPRSDRKARQGCSSNADLPSRSTITDHSGTTR